MEISKIILIIQFLFAFTCLLIQFYALCSVRWALFESRVELGLIEEHGHYGLWSMCTYRRLMPAQFDESGKILLDPDCDSMNTFFTPGHPRAFISFFVICHTLSLIVFCLLILFRLIEISQDYWRKNDNTDIEMNPNKAKRFLILFSRLFPNRIQSIQIDHEYYIKNQIRKKLYAISVAVLSTMLALAGALMPHQALRETDIFLLTNVSRNNYRVWRGPGFWAQLTTMIMDMLITTLIVIEVRVVFVMFHQQSYPVTPVESISSVRSSSTERPSHSINSTTSQFDNYDDNVIVNPFSRNNEIIGSNENHNQHNHHHRHHQRLAHSATPSPRSTIPKSVSPTTVSVGVETENNSFINIKEFNKNSYVNSEEVRQMKHQKDLNLKGTTSYCNPIFKEEF